MSKKGKARSAFSQTPYQLGVKLLDILKVTREHQRLTKAETAEALKLVKAGADLSVKGEGQQQALLCAVLLNDIEVVKALLKKGADVDAQNLGGNSAFMAAAAWRSYEMIEAVLAACPNPYLKDTAGLTAHDYTRYFDRGSGFERLAASAEALYAVKLARMTHRANGLPLKNDIARKALKPRGRK